MTSFKGLFDCLYDPIPKKKKGGSLREEKGLVVQMLE